MRRIILFDGECNFCDQSVQFIIKRDPKGDFKFASLQSETGKELLSKYNASKSIDSIILIEDGHCYYKSSAALRICKKLKGAWKLLYLFIILPRPLRDFFYDIIARNRYKWFGKNESCRIPSPEERKRFL
ncbi:thiol-disulfide oxidoreductase DCC family protein [Bacillus luteolus]|uniref:Thiol-disulfide oxidoreductase DCC family protein n=1 Tax=Litchfieldia luteola TaxID=682179 RepID=A0ABR9QP05_9BACI|nr:thiol-disulfide oxidoreductase DCC family protein [Cytobacillus luteolus]MBE4910221.1 thiol-disulfide oxidoreductase DCC family protein [Cytobacillus luteolus]MBP1942209.1 putative DCC family thiol-disulfide oxidoreductase YuxK [Cytobacillus luteolus]